MFHRGLREVPEAGSGVGSWSFQKRGFAGVVLRFSKGVQEVLQVQRTTERTNERHLQNKDHWSSMGARQQHTCFSNTQQFFMSDFNEKKKTDTDTEFLTKGNFPFPLSSLHQEFQLD